ncbi:hypothetical protein FHT40_000694 [Mycolicibacterium sp. BK556]|uniref:DUF6049 family protein n=1 Tax=unclassified Mycolicibacterium TaxID=2636767 RepID=UPI0016090ABE|nr:hypothetical protein [Mycolicibacterium sp. BK556]MBB3630815.1 hypothetical protein [Mycolicibacterium sp. BK607]MBB3748811.1 hypothetical protein [Mycolicibacterium sp. BK634]
MTTPRRVGILPRIVVILGVLALLAMPTTAPAAAGEPGSTPFLQVRIDSVSPDLITTTSEPMVTVTGTVTNVGDRPVRDVVARLEHAGAVTSSAGLRTNLDGANDQFQPVGEFTTVAPEMQRGQAVGFTFSYPIRSRTAPSLGIDKPGVYPLLVNINGTPDYGDAARLDDARFLLPVLGVPPEAADPATDTVADVVPPDTTKPVAVTMFWPLADKPRLAPGVPGGTTPVRLMNDDLAVSLAAGGRLDTLLSAVEFATSPAVDPGGDTARALCLAVDPDLLVTVNAMTAGYVVADAPDGLGAAAHPGTGQAAAVAWLDKLRGLAKRMCVAPTPYAQADLGALERVGDAGLKSAATGAAGDIIDQILGVTSVRGATILGDGPLTRPAVDLLSGQGSTVAIAAADCSAQDSSTGEPMIADVTPRRLSPQVVMAPFDPAVGAALAAVGTDPDLPTYLDSSLNVPLDHDSTVARRQDAVASMLWRSLQPAAEPRTQILLPPLKWSPQPSDAQSMLTALATTIHSGLAVARPLDAVITQSPTLADAASPGAELPGASRGQFDDDVVSTITGQVGRLWGLTAALTTDPRTGLTGPQYTAPLREDMLRALSQTEPADERNDLARRRLGAVGTTINDLFGAVTIVNPGGSYTLATEHSPLPLAVRNDLAVPIRVRLQVDAPPGMTVTDLGEQEVPPGYLPLRVPIEVHFTQRVAVDVALRTPDGLQLGEPVRLSVHSNAYGKVLFAITLIGGTVLALLVGRRLYHRFRGEPDPADLDRPRRAAAEGRE